VSSIASVGDFVGDDPREQVVISAAPVASRVASELRRQLAEGQRTPGSRLSEPAITEQLGVSRNTLREAFVELAAERLVQKIPNRGMFVASPSIEDVRDCYSARRIIEVGAIRRGGSPERISYISAAVERGQTAAKDGHLAGLALANQDFHRGIVAMAQSRRLNSLMEQLLAEMRLFLYKESVDVDFYSRYLEHNARISRRLDAGDVDEAASLLMEYLDTSERHLVDIHLREAETGNCSTGSQASG
jgi:DNA-binding GntR family transcriptional regulator